MCSLLQIREDYKQVSLNDLLYYYLGAQTQNNQKDSVHKLMRQDPNFWHTLRPLSLQLLEYAAQDVLFLP